MADLGDRSVPLGLHEEPPVDGMFDRQRVGVTGAEVPEIWLSNPLRVGHVREARSTSLNEQVDKNTCGVADRHGFEMFGEQRDVPSVHG